MHEIPRAYVNAFLGAALFGLSAPLLAALDAGGPRVTAALLYGGYGVIFAAVFRPWRDRVARGERRWLAVSLGFGGVLAPLLMLLGLRSVAGAEAALWLGAEPLFTVLLGVLLFREPSSPRLWASMVLVVASGGVLVNVGAPSPGILYLLAAAAAWGLDNQASARLVSIRPESLTAWKGLAGFTGNAVLAWAFSDSIAGAPVTWAAVALVGVLSYGVSLLLVLRAMRHLGGGRAATAFAVSPFVGAAAGFALGQAAAPAWALVASAVLVGAAGRLLLGEEHAHEHVHEPMEHTHEHVHDAHHQHAHVQGDPPGEPHTHRHRHVRLVHAHPHLADVHHRHH